MSNQDGTFFSDSIDVKGGETKGLELKVPNNGGRFFWGFDIPDGKKVFFSGMDIAGVSTLKLKFYNSEAAGTGAVTVTAFTRIFTNEGSNN